MEVQALPGVTVDLEAGRVEILHEEWRFSFTVWEGALVLTSKINDSRGTRRGVNRETFQKIVGRAYNGLRAARKMATAKRRKKSPQPLLPLFV